MKKLRKNKFIWLLLVLPVIFINRAAAQDDPVAPTEIVKLHYYNTNNSLQYLLLESLLKKGKKTEPHTNQQFTIYLDKNQPENLVAKLLTDQNGKAKAIIPPRLKNTWDSAAQHTFLVVATGKEGETTSEYPITKAKISLDTTSSDGTKNITVAVMKYQNAAWMPVKDVEMKIGIERSGGILPAGDEDTYTTDSLGTVTTGLKKINLPGDEQGSFLLIARVEDNDELGNLVVEKKVPWGTITQQDNNFFKQRTLWSTRFNTPLWLLFMAYSIVLGVWGTVIYLIIQLIKIKKLASSPT